MKWSLRSELMGSFGIGRRLGCVLSLKEIEVVAVDDGNPDIENITYTMNYDSLYSGYIKKKKFTCNGQNIDYGWKKKHPVYCAINLIMCLGQNMKLMY